MPRGDLRQADYYNHQLINEVLYPASSIGSGSTRPSSYYCSLARAAALEEIDAALLFADVSGVTPLTKTLQELKGPVRGAEDLLHPSVRQAPIGTPATAG